MLILSSSSPAAVASPAYLFPRAPRIDGIMNSDGMDQDDFNSTDIEYEPATDAFAYAGAQSVEQMLQHAVEDRLESKKRSKQLTFVHGSKMTQYINRLWYNRFTSFRAMVLKVDDTTPRRQSKSSGSSVPLFR
ncbi:hypothetical protein V1506DRAFT_78562 [Lipomyces tetrasporus]